MAQRVSVTLIDDLDGESEAQDTITFGLDGRTYEIDLTEAHETELRTFLERFVTKARRKSANTGAGGRRKQVTPIRSETEPSAEVYRKWAESNGFEVNARGRVPASIKEAYHKAND
ncbi:histone-like nucleoid-structuring protein Lsr2 [Streptomyces sp. PsTaAH-124]|uniref:histone-like nucleoid-structuring protein Lsr2 n=1 Tax=Streptomyces sp. PsTaAH-124 TaxID=1157638 RepID=UPI0003699B39|nr:Lsr2 family protein [Streptomyces sp. PsTaAH-124]